MEITKGILKKVQVKIYEMSSYISLSITNILGNSYTVDDCNIITPYGQGSYPVDTINGVITTINGSNKLYACLGFSLDIPDKTKIPYTFNQGESWQYSKKYVLVQQNDGINAYRYNDLEFKTTLPQGEFSGIMMNNRINELQSQIQYLTSLVKQLQSHVHTYTDTGVVADTSPPTTVFTPITTPDTLQKDANLISQEAYLINDKGKKYPS